MASKIGLFELFNIAQLEAYLGTGSDVDGSNSRSSMSNSDRGSMGSIAMGIGHRVGSGVTNMLLGSNMRNMGNGLVNSDVVLVNDGGLDDVLHRVHLVGLGHSVGLGHFNGVGLGHVLLVDDLLFDRDGDGDGDLDGVLVDLELGLDAGHLGGDDGVSPDGGGNPLDGDSVGGGGALVGGCGGDGGVGSRGGRKGRGSNGHSGLRSLGGLSHVGVGGGLVGLFVLSVGVASLHSLGSNLDSAVTDDLMGGVGHWGSGMHMLLHTVSYNSGGSCVAKAMVGQGPLRGGLAEGQEH